jgi:sulfonate transport system permease protein
MTTLVQDRVTRVPRSVRKTPRQDSSGALIDLSPRPWEAGRRAAQARWQGLLLRGAAPLVTLLIWQLAGSFNLVTPEVLPAPADIVAAFAELIRLGDLQAALPVSLGRALTGLAIGGTAGLVASLLAGLWWIGEALFDAPLQMLRAIPFIPLVPLFNTWFGIDELAKLVVIIAATIFPMYLNTYAGVRGVDPKLLEAVTIFDTLIIGSSRGMLFCPRSCHRSWLGCAMRRAPCCWRSSWRSRSTHAQALVTLLTMPT